MRKLVLVLNVALLVCPVIVALAVSHDFAADPVRLHGGHALNPTYWVLLLLFFAAPLLSSLRLLRRYRSRRVLQGVEMAGIALSLLLLLSLSYGWAAVLLVTVPDGLSVIARPTMMLFAVVWLAAGVVNLAANASR